MEAEKRKALSMYLRDIRDPRRRQGRIYPLASILTMLTLAAVNGESTLRGMWKWVEQHWEQIRDRLELEWAESPPQYGTLWNVMARVELRHVEEAVRRWLKDSLGEAISVDAKSLRGSRRELPALSVVVAAGQKVQLVLAQEEVKGGERDRSSFEANPGAAPRGAGSHARCGVESARDCRCNCEKGGAYLGVVKDNHARLREILLQDLLARQGASLKQRNRRHGRVENREYWWVEADEEMRMYLERELGWPQVRWYGWVKRQRKRLRSGEWSEEEVVWISRKR